MSEMHEANTWARKARLPERMEILLYIMLSFIHKEMLRLLSASFEHSVCKQIASVHYFPISVVKVDEVTKIFSIVLVALCYFTSNTLPADDNNLRMTGSFRIKVYKLCSTSQ